MRFYSSLIVTLFISTSLRAQDFYVSPSGSNSNSGSFTSPWMTIQKAASTTTAGSTVYIMQGTYYEKVTVQHSGTAGNLITFRNYNQDSVFIDGTGISGTTMLTISGKNYITIQGLIIQNRIKNNAQGILIQGNCSYITIKKCAIHDISWTSDWNAVASSNKNSQPFICYGNKATTAVNHIVIDSNTFYHNITGFSESCTVDGNVDSFEIRFNKVYNNRNIGILMAGNYHVSSDPNTDHARNGVCSDNDVHDNVSNYAANGGIYVDGGWNNIIERNILHGNVYGIEVGCEKNPNGAGTTQNNIVRDNLIYNNLATGIEFGGYNYPHTGTVINCSFLNNTCYHNDTGDSIGSEMDISHAENCTVRNNIFYANSGKFLYSIGVDSSYHNHFDYNSWYNGGTAAKAKFKINGTTIKGFSKYKNQTLEDEHSVYSDPLFVIAGQDFHLQSTSPCVDAGDPAFVAGNGEKDLDYHKRIYNSRVDIGCYEFGSSFKLISTNFQADEIKIFPNPAYNAFTVSTSGNENSKLRIFDLKGRMIFIQQSLQGINNLEIDCSQWTRGIYLLQMESNNKSATGKLIVQ